jgi:hypothetical protein
LIDDGICGSIDLHGEKIQKNIHSKKKRQNDDGLNGKKYIPLRQKK